MTTQVKRGKLGYEDVEFGLGTFQRYGPTGFLETLTQIRASHIPILDALALYEADEVEAALAEVRGVIDTVDFPETVQRVEILCTAPWEIEYTGVGLMHENLKDMNTLLQALHPSHQARHIRAGADEIDGDQLDIDWNPTNYTPAVTPAEVDHLDHLTSHLYGVDVLLGTIYTFLASCDLTDHRVLVGSGAGAITPLGAMTDGQLVVGATGADPAPQSVGGDATLAADGTLAFVGDKAIKGWVNFDSEGAFTVNDSFNVASVTDNAEGDYTVNWDTDFSNTSYVVVGTAAINAAANSMNVLFPNAGTYTGAATQIRTENYGGSSKDSPRVNIIAIGDQ